MNFNLSKVSVKTLDARDYYRFINRDNLLILKRLKDSLSGISVIHLNTDPKSGGVAEMLSTLVPLQNSLGVKTEWQIVPPDETFFEITKDIHNFLQGKKGQLNSKQKKYYLNYNKLIAKSLGKLKFDILVVHDPQPAASVHFLKKTLFRSIWRSHIDTSTPNLKVWNFIKTYLDRYDRYIFTLKKYSHKQFPKKNFSYFTPCIDPLSKKNKRLSLAKARKVVSSFGIDIKKPFITQVSRFDPWKDPWGVIDAYRLAKKSVSDLQLIFVAQSSTDDPEEIVTQKSVFSYVKNNPDVKFVVDSPNNDIVVNAFQTASDIILQKSTREGFGLTVTEAMWKKNVVIGGDTPGIRRQIQSGENGYIVKSPQECSRRIVSLIRDKRLRHSIGYKAHQSVKKEFLITHLLINYLRLFKFLVSK